MLWQALLTCLLAMLAGGVAFCVIMLTKPRPTFLTASGLVAMAAIPPDVASGLAIGAWLAWSFFLKTREGIVVPNERITWRRAVSDALEVTGALLVGLIYMYRRRTLATPGPVLLAGLCLALAITLCYFHAVAGEIPRQIRVRHGYAVGLLSFIPWGFHLARLGWRLLVLGFLTFLLWPPFLLATVDLRLARPVRQHRRRRPRMMIRLP